MPGTQRPLASDAVAVLVRLPDGRTLRFLSSFHIGREPGCEVEVADSHVSRRHAEVSLVGGEWLIRDLQSSNGLLVDGRRADTAPIGDGVEITLGVGGPSLHIEPERAAVAPERTDPNTDNTLEAYAQHYFGSEKEEEDDEKLLSHKIQKNTQ